MKICREIKYDDFDINDKNGWKASYNVLKLRWILNKIQIIVWVLGTILAFTIIRELDFKSSDIMISVGAAILIWVFILTPIHKLLHFVPYVGFRFNEKCYVLLEKKSISTFYKGETSRDRLCLSLLTPLLVISFILAFFIIFSTGIYKFFVVFIFALHIAGSYTDIYMIIYYLRNFRSDTVFFGNRCKEKH